MNCNAFYGYGVPFGTYLEDGWKDTKARLESLYPTVKILDYHVKDDNGNMKTSLFAVAASSTFEGTGCMDFSWHQVEDLEKELHDFRLKEGVFAPGKMYYGRSD